MIRIYILFGFLLILATQSAMSAPNCNVYKENEKCYMACLEAEKAERHPQGSKESQQHFLKSISLCPEFAYSYFEHGVPFAKRGQMDAWKKLIDKAVELAPEEYLGIRGWYHWIFMNNYEKAIADIERLDELLDRDIGETGDGFYHLNAMKALCYKGLGNFEKAIEVLEDCIASTEYYQGYYDNLHLGVLYLKVGNHSRALQEFKKQMEFNDVSEAYFYSAMVYQELKDSKKAREYLNMALEKYDAKIGMHNPYRQLMDEIYRLDIEEALNVLN